MKRLSGKITSFLESRIVKRICNPELFFLLVAFLLIESWFNKGMLFGGVEVGVPTYTPTKTLKEIIWTWWEANGPGLAFPTVPAAIPLYIVMVFLERIGIGAIGIQKILFFSIIYLQGLGISLIFRKIFPQIRNLASLAGLFYIFNPYMMTYVWHRFIYGGIILSAALPLLIYFYLRLLEEKKFKFVLFFILTSLFANYMYSAVAPVIAVWLSIAIICFSMVIINRKDIKKISHILFLTFTLLIFWLLTNIWWIYPLINIKTIFSVFTLSGDVNTLISLSEKSTINYVIRGINPYAMFYEEDWGNIYQIVPFQFLSWIPVMLILFGLTFKLYRKKLWSMILLFLIGIFVAKGAAEPLGNMTAWIYSHFFILGVIRNPFEKLGLLVILPASIIMTIGINNLWNLNRRLYLKVLTILLIIGCGVYVWPMWSDKLFGSDKYPLFFTVPSDYKEVSNFLLEQLKTDNGKILHLPISESDSATYNWQHPYNGTAIASHLFPGTSISKFVYISFVDQLLQETARIFHTTNYDLQRKIVANFNVKYIVINKNLDWYFRKVDNPNLVEQILDLSPDLQVIKETNNLKVYKFIAQTKQSVYSASQLSLISKSFNNAKEVDFAFDKTQINNGVFLQQPSNQKIPLRLIGEEIILPQRVFNDDSIVSENPDIIIPKPYVKHLPGSLFYQLALMKEQVELWLDPVYEKPMTMLLFTQKRLIESQQLKQRKQESEFNKSIGRYAIYLDQAINSIKQAPKEELEGNTKVILGIALSEERQLLESFKNNVSSKEIELLITDCIQKILDLRKAVGLDIYYPYSNNTANQDKIDTYQFFIPNNTKANVILISPTLEAYTEDKMIKIIVDGKPKDALLSKTDGQNRFSLGEIELMPGIHEIGIPVPVNTTLVKIGDFIRKKGEVLLGDQNKPVTIMTSKEDSWLEYAIPDYNPDKTYVLRFYYRIIKGAAPQIQFWQNSDEWKNNTQAKIVRNLPNNSYDFDWGYAEYSISTNNIKSIQLDRATTEPRIRLTAPYWNNCESINYRKARLCKNLKFKESYNKPSTIEIRDLKIDEVFNAGLFLDKTLNNTFVSSSPVDVKKISPVEYSIETMNNNHLYVVLNESFHSGWQVILDNPKEVIKEENHFLTNGYANGWLINRTGALSFKIKFTPQDNFNKGILISIFSYLVITLVLIGKNIIKK